MPFFSQHALVGEIAAPGCRKAPAGAVKNAGSISRNLAPLNISIEIVDDLASVAVLWKVFERIADCTPFQTFGWLDNWQRHVGSRKGTQPVVVFGRSNDGDIL